MRFAQFLLATWGMCARCRSRFFNQLSKEEREEVVETFYEGVSNLQKFHEVEKGVVTWGNSNRGL